MGSKKKKEYWAGFDLGGTKMLCVVFDKDFQAVGRSRRKTKGHEGMSAGLKRINENIHDAIEDAGLEPDDICGIGIGCPGPLDFEQGVIREAPNLGWENIPIKESIEDEFGCPAVIANDVDAGLFGEYQFGAAQDVRCAFGIFPGTGIGGACVYEGKLFRGTNTSCMEIGHIPLITGGPLDGAGNAGSLESVASRLAIAGNAAQSAYRGQAPHLMENAGTDISQIRSGALANSVKAGDQAVAAIVEQAAEQLGLAVVTVVHLLAPDVIVFGGGLIEAMSSQILPIVEEVASQRILPSLKNEFSIVEATLGDDAAVMGAAALARQSVDQD
ncbi:MAG: ROK family protein [Mariniblastus sp.]|nr:ROK family protein [Mariniblastus sp.]